MNITSSSHAVPPKSREGQTVAPLSLPFFPDHRLEPFVLIRVVETVNPLLDKGLKTFENPRLLQANRLFNSFSGQARIR